MKRIGVVPLIASLLIGTAAASPARAADATYPAKVQARASVVAMAIGADGRHHVLMDNENRAGMVYAVESAGRWLTHDLPGAAITVGDVAVAGDGTPVIAVPSAPSSENTGPVQLVTLVNGVWTVENVNPGGGNSSLRRIRVGVGSDGVIHVAYSFEAQIRYSAKTGGVWSSMKDVDPPSRPVMGFASWDMVLDSSNVPHFVVSGQTSSTPAGAPCVEFVGCTVDIVPDGAGWAVTPISAASGQPDAIYTDSGGLEVAVNDGVSVDYVGRISGDWATELAVPETSGGSAIARGPQGPVILYSIGNIGLFRADRSPSGWGQSTIASGRLYFPVASIDGLGRPHIGYRLAYDDPVVGATSDAFLRAPDDTAPTIGIPGVRPRSNATIGSTIPMTVSWTAADSQSGLSHFRLQQKTDTGSWSTVSSTLTTAWATRTLAIGHTYQFRVVGYDRAGLASTWHTSLPARISRYSENSSLIHYTGTWAASTSSTADGGRTKFTTSTAGRATIRFTGTAFAWVAPMSSTRGRGDVFIDGLYAGEGNLYKSTTAARVVVFSYRWATSGTHTVQIRNRPTSTRKRIDIDTILIVR